MKDSREKEVFFFPSSFWQHCHVLLKMSLWQNSGPRLQVPCGHIWWKGVRTVLKYSFSPRYSGGFSLSHNLRQGFISFPFQHWPQPFHALTTLQNQFLTARNHLKWEWESLTSGRVLGAKSFRREKRSQGVWVIALSYEGRGEKKKKKPFRHVTFKFFKLYKMFRLHTIKLYFCNIFERIHFRNERQISGCRGLWGNCKEKVVVIIKGQQKESLCCWLALLIILTVVVNMPTYTGDKIYWT